MSEMSFEFSEAYAPDFKPYICHCPIHEGAKLEELMILAFKKLHVSERLLIKPLLELQAFKVLKASYLQGETTGTVKKADVESKELERINREIQARLDVLNANGDLNRLVRTFLEHVFDLSDERSLAKRGEVLILNFVENLHRSGELVI